MERAEMKSLNSGRGTAAARAEVEYMISTARSLAASSQSSGKARALYDAILGIDPTRLELHVEVARLEVMRGRPDRAEQRIKMLGEHYEDEANDGEAGAFLRASPAWEEEFDDSWDRELSSLAHVPSMSKDAARREQVFARYSIPTLRARARVRRNTGAAKPDPSTPLAKTLRRLGSR